jgi:hypothetical protein
VSNKWEIVTAISTASTAVIALFTYTLVRWQWYLNKPTVTYNTSYNKQNSYAALNFSIEGAEKEKWSVKKLKVTSPRSANVAEKISGPDNKPVPSIWVKELSFNPQANSGGIYFTAPSEAKVTFKIYTSLKVNRFKTISHKISVEMHKYEKP